MEIQNLDELKIKDFEFYKGSGASYYPLLRKYKIETISQLLDDETMNKLMSRCGYETRNELNVLISMAKNKYLNMTLPGDVLLDKKLIIDNNRFYIEVKDKYKKRFDTEEFVGTDLNRAKRWEKEFSKTDIYDENTKLIDYLNWLLISNNLNSVEYFVVSAYIDSYEKNKDVIAKDNGVNTIEYLKKQLTDLISMRDSLNNQISSLQQEIADLSKIEDMGGMKK